ncbi:MAG: L-2-amino-thiazoline-4-carboxylic acid hydrolase [Oligoflexia bacterium]|nr:L-2-amino-thiazoline-4-carboxylic acid hydrolase [Oligoflexia bacterium]
MKENLKMDKINLKNDRTITLLEEVKLQAEIVIPIYTKLKELYGIEQATTIIRNAIAEWYNDRYVKMASSIEGSAYEKWAAMMSDLSSKGGGGVVEVEWIENTPSKVVINVTKCKYAEHFKMINQPELGTFICCDVDRHIAKAAGITSKTEVEIKRTKTIMEGAASCDLCCLFK